MHNCKLKAKGRLQLISTGRLCRLHWSCFGLGRTLGLCLWLRSLPTSRDQWWIIQIKNMHYDLQTHMYSRRVAHRHPSTPDKACCARDTISAGFDPAAGLGAGAAALKAGVKEAFKSSLTFSGVVSTFMRVVALWVTTSDDVRRRLVITQYWKHSSTSGQSGSGVAPPRLTIDLIFSIGQFAWSMSLTDHGSLSARLLSDFSLARTTLDSQAARFSPHFTQDRRSLILSCSRPDCKQ